MTTPTDNLVRASAVARYLGVSRQSVFCWAKQGGIPCYRLGESTIRFRLSEIKEWVDSCRHGSRVAGCARQKSATQQDRMIA